MNADLSDFLLRSQSVATETVYWANGTMPLHITTYVTGEEPPLTYVTTVRAIVLRGDEVMVVRDTTGSVHIMPGGRREAGETLEQTVNREVAEETGWAIAGLNRLGVLHFHHLAPKPEGYRYPYPDFLQLVFIADADRPAPEAREIDGGETEAVFRAIGDLETLGVPQSQQRLLQMALAIRPV